MLRTAIAAGLAGSMIFLSAFAVRAEDAPAQSPASSSCSGLLCIFAGGSSQPAPAAARHSAPTPAQRAEAQAGAAADKLDVDAATNALDRKLAGERRARARIAQARAAQAKVVREKAVQAKAMQANAVQTKTAGSARAVTIAVDDVELDRMKDLAKEMRKEPIRLVKAQDGHTAAADMTVAAKIDPSADRTGPKLFVEQLHIVGGAKINSVADLKEKAVSFGPDGSATQAAARKAFAALDIRVKETPLDVDNALDGVATGDLAAVALLAPQPAEPLKKVTGLHLVAWPENGEVPSGAVLSTIDGAAYPGLAKPGEKIRAVGVDAVLSVSAVGARQPATRIFINALSQHAPTLSQRGFDLLKADLDANSARKFAVREHR